jgi:hypothetical protein
MVMRVLEARFHPWRKACGPFLVVGRVIFRHKQPEIQPTPAGIEEQPEPTEETMLQKLAYLVSRSRPDPFDRLRSLRSDFWSFVEVADNDGE